MKQEKWHNGQLVLTNDLNRAQSTKESAILDRMSDAFNGGIVLGVHDQFKITVSLTDYTKIDIGTGLAYSDVGERILIDDALQYSSANPATMSPDGLGGMVSTPRSTGHLSVPLTSGQYNYVFVKHLNSTDTSITSGTVVSGEIIYPKIDDGYEVVIVTSPTHVTDAYTLVSNPTQVICVGYVNYTAGGDVLQTNVFGTIDNRYEFKRFAVNKDVVRTAISPTPIATRPTYALGSDVTSTDHINCVGSGTVTNVNPHGLTLSDLDAILKSTENHEAYVHAAGITAPGTSNSTVSALRGNIVAQGPVPFPTLDNVVIEGLSVLESVIKNGLTANTSHVSQRYVIYFQDSPTGTTYLEDGSYVVYLDLLTHKFGLASTMSNGMQFYLQIRDRALPVENVLGEYTGTVQPLTAITNESSLFPLWQIDFTTTGPEPGGRNGTNIPLIGAISNFTNRVDLRRFGTIGTDQLSSDAATNTVVINHSVTSTGKLHVDGNITSPIGLPPGLIFPYAGAIIDDGSEKIIGGYLLCNGAAVSRSAYSDLFAAIGITHGQGDGVNTFNIPDYRGRFLRGTAGVSGRDPDVATRTSMNLGGNAGALVGSVQEDAMQGHKHRQLWDTVNLNAWGYRWKYEGNDNENPGADTGLPIDGGYGAPRYGYENRPKNAYVNYLIKY